jgi:hypothetical protein
LNQQQAKRVMTRDQLTNEDDADKTRQQLIDDLQNEIAQLRGEKELLGGIINIAADAIISIDEICVSIIASASSPDTVRKETGYI